MAFFVPEKFQGLIDDVDHRFRLLLQKRVVTGIDEMKLDAWLANFVSLEDKYLAARLLDGLTFRSESMVCSSVDHLLQCVLPGELRRLGLFPYSCIDAFLHSLVHGDGDHPIRFVAIDGTHDVTPGKSGAVVIRLFRRHANISKHLTCRPENIAALPTTVKCLVFVDDMVGTGTQFLSFAKHYDLQSHSPQRHLLYCPLIAYAEGEAHIEKSASWMLVRPVERMDERHQFFRASSQVPGTWSADESNTIDDVRQHLKGLALSRKIPVKTKYTRDLLLGFEHATPNNTLPVMWARSPHWSPLLTR